MVTSRLLSRFNNVYLYLIIIIKMFVVMVMIESLMMIVMMIMMRMVCTAWRTQAQILLVCLWGEGIALDRKYHRNSALPAFTRHH